MASEEQELDGNGSSPEIVDGLEPSTEINNETDINPECLPCDTTDTDEMTSTSEQNGESDESCAIESSWGFSLEELFGMALKFFKEMDGKAFHPAYEEKLRLVALHKQVSVGPYNPGACSEIGFFDVLGNDRRKEWIRLGSMAKEDAMEDFVKLLNSCCHLFAAYVTSHKIEKEEQERRRREEEERLRLEMEEEERRHREEEQRREKEEQERKKKEEEKRKREEGEKLQIEEQKQKIMAVLNAQTAVHFQQYAAQQYPDNPKQQQALTQMLQEKHYQQFMQQAYSQQQQALQRQQEGSVESSQPEALFPHSSDMANPNGQAHHDSRTQEDGLEPPLSDDHIRDMHYGTGEVSMGISSPSMWTRPQIGDFKEKMRSDVDSVVTVGRGEVLTISVPTNENGSFLFWEFATDHCDIGFGLFFKWTDTLDDKVIGPYADEDAGDGTTQQEVEKAREVEEVVPVFRRDSHQEVYAGSHRYPGHGVYLLKFDNSYSLWRSKVVYYRVYYTR